ncbi:beta-1,4-galactosyltransferase 4 isoform X2 [Nycticebus coucang]|uniref:beta-1,4-galactosyltransferase 4 isoform X2 n=1 Tax=Nycticebus coucang TaxID=9470 RepID=UPI00234DFC95|nr:beta-1,4-galactosyltransferase 4 isoform X2 [Nycticebus coucang]
MGFNLTFHLSYKFRLLLLFTLCVMVVGWATSDYFVGVIQEIPKAKDFMFNFNKALTLGKEETTTNEASMKKAELDICPSVSPHLRGQSKLIFKPDLTWEEVQAENPKVHRGRYHPKECEALQRVAILIPHRNREKHLMYLLEHLHPFLQRQQLDYGIYIIHQAGNKKFNRAKLLNVGYLEALKEENWDCFIFHDVDLVPENDFNIYKCEDQPRHLVVGRNSTGYRLRYNGYFGGVTALSREQFFKMCDCQKFSIASVERTEGLRAGPVPMSGQRASGTFLAEENGFPDKGPHRNGHSDGQQLFAASLSAWLAMLVNWMEGICQISG